MTHLTLDKVSVHYDGQPAPAVERVSLDIAKGDFVVLSAGPAAARPRCSTSPPAWWSPRAA